MDRKHQIAICKNCEHQLFDKQVGIICGLTKELQTFEIQCETFIHSKEKSKSIIENYSQRTPIAEAASRMEEKANNASNISDDANIADIKKISSGARWFSIIAILSIVNSILVYTGTELNFIFGLGSTTMLDVLIRDITDSQSLILLLPQFVIAGIFLACGYTGKRQSTTAYLVGIILYSLDALVFLLFKNYLAIGFHGFALIGMISGYSHLRKLKANEKKESLQ